MPTEGKQRSAALVTRAGDQWSLIFLKRLWLHFFRGRGIADPRKGRLSGSTARGFEQCLTSCPSSKLDAGQVGDGHHVSWISLKAALKIK